MKTPDQIRDDKIARLEKKTQALATWADMFSAVTQKAQDLKAAAVRIGKAYSTAAGRHKEAVSKQNQMKALETQLMFSVLTVLTSGALSWATELIKVAGAAKAASRMKAIEDMGALYPPYPWYQDAVKSLIPRLKDKLAKQVSARELYTSVIKDTVSAGLGEVFSAMGPLYAPPPVSEPASQEPLEFQDDLVSQIDKIEGPAMLFLTRMASKIKSLRPEAWDDYDDGEFQAGYEKWQREAYQLAGVTDLPDEKEMADELERFIWALWIPGLVQIKHVVRNPGFKGRFGYGVKEEDVEVYERVREPIDDRFVALGVLKTPTYCE
jgi:hypothetical protein